jgi:tetratricopeptide (TPR) repeat protein
MNRHSAEGVRLYQARDYEAAIDTFAEAYTIEREPNLLFNTARCYEALGHHRSAIDFYENFLDQPGLEARGRLRANEALKALRAYAARESERKASARSGAEASARDAQTVTDAGTQSKAGWVAPVVIGSGVALGAAGATFYLLGVRDHSKVTGAAGYEDPTGVYALSRSEGTALVRSGDSKKLLGWVGMSAGGAVLVGYALAVLLDGFDDDPVTAPLGAGLSPTEGGAAAYVRGSF